jgi:hypothetical protein
MLQIGLEVEPFPVLFAAEFRASYLVAVNANKHRVSMSIEISKTNVCLLSIRTINYMGQIVA